MMGGEKQYKIVWFNNIISILSLVTGTELLGRIICTMRQVCRVRPGEI